MWTGGGVRGGSAYTMRMRISRSFAFTLLITLNSPMLQREKLREKEAHAGSSSLSDAPVVSTFVC